jgi:CRISPR-associated endonuclease/helicase Cas3
LASLRFALHHAAKHQMDRIIYAIPFTSIIDQNARVVREILEPAGVTTGSIVLENHSNLLPEKQSWKTKMLSENWDAPVVYTTNVQILETLFGAGTRGARRMHQLANSVIVFDEIQTLPIKCIHLFCNAINFLVEQCHATVVLCTATQPLINLVASSKGALRLGAGSEIMPDVADLFMRLKRVNVCNRRRPGGWSNDDVAALALEEVRAAGSCLVIVNTKKMAQALFTLCRQQADLAAHAPEPFFIYHLSTNMCPRHRKAILDKVCQHLKADEAVLCISTQLIEAGVDVDFGAVIRSIAGLDSIAQAAGRCNRNGRRAIGTVHIVNLAEERAEMLTDIACGQAVTERLLDEFEQDPTRFDHDLIGPKAIEWFFRYYFGERHAEMDYPVGKDNGTRDDTLLNLLSTNPKAADEHYRLFGSHPKHYLGQSFMSAANAFKSIDAPTQGVIVPYGEAGENLINQMKSTYLLEKQFELLHSAQQFTVNVFPGDLSKLLKLGAVREIQQDIDILYLDALYYYDDFGLGLTAKPMGVYCV